MSVINFGPKPCERVRSYLDSYLSNELLIETNHEVLGHLESCAECAAILAERAHVRTLLQRAVRSETAPASLREKIQRDIRRSPLAIPLRAPKSHLMLAVAASLVLLLGGWAVFQAWDARTVPVPSELAHKLLMLGVSDHVQCAIDHGNAGKRYTFEQMSQAMGPEYIGLVPLAKEKVPENYEVVVAHKCRVAGRGFVHLIMKEGDSVVSLVITKKTGESFPPNALTAVVQGPGMPLHQARLQDLEVTGFETRDHLAFVVSNLPASNNLQIATGLAPAVKTHLAGLEL